MSRHEDRRHRRGRVHRVDAGRDAGRGRARGRRARRLHPVLPAPDEGGQPRRARPSAVVPLRGDRPAHGRPRPVARRRRCRHPRGGHGRPHAQLDRPRALHVVQHPGHQPADRSGPAGRGAAVRPGLDVVGLRARGGRRRGSTRSSRHRPTASPSSPARSSCWPMSRRTGSRPRSSATSRSTGRASGPTWPTTSSSRRCSTGEPITVYGDGEQTRSNTYIDDAVHGHDPRPRAGRHGRHLQHRWRQDDLAQRGDRRSSPVISASSRASSWEPARPGDQRHTSADITRAREAFGLRADGGARRMGWRARSPGTSGAATVAAATARRPTP